MKLDNFPPQGTQFELHKWYFWLELRAYPPYMLRCFRPHLFFGMRKYSDFGHLGMIGGREPQYVGFDRSYTFPFAVRIEIFR